MRVKIYGAGSIGNHLANASRQLDWRVDICDIDAKALQSRGQVTLQKFNQVIRLTDIVYTYPGAASPSLLGVS